MLAETKSSDGYRKQRYIEVGAKTEKEGRGKMNNSLTIGMKQSVRVLGAVWYRRVL